MEVLKCTQCIFSMWNYDDDDNGGGGGGGGDNSKL